MRYIGSLLLVFSSFFLISSTSLAQTAPDGTYIYAPERSTGGIGRFYMGREISGVMATKPLSG